MIRPMLGDPNTNTNANDSKYPNANWSMHVPIPAFENATAEKPASLPANAPRNVPVAAPMNAPANAPAIIASLFASLVSKFDAPTNANMNANMNETAPEKISSNISTKLLHCRKNAKVDPTQEPIIIAKNIYKYIDHHHLFLLSTIKP